LNSKYELSISLSEKYLRGISRGQSYNKNDTN